jgi:hypothetical protein
VETEAVIMGRPRLFPRVAAGIAALAALSLTVGAQAQHTPDPYNIVGEYNLGYEDNIYASYPNGAGLNPNQALLQGRVGAGRANTFQSYLDSLDGGSGDSLFGGSSRNRGGAGVPYYRAHKEFDDAFDRIYTPNAISDETFRADQEKRTKLYVEYLKEPDPKKRAQLYRAYLQQSRQTARDSGAGSARAANRGRAESSPTPSQPPASRVNSFRLPSRVPSTSPRLRGAAPSSSSETADDILDRATRPSRPVTAPPGFRSSSVAPR